MMGVMDDTQGDEKMYTLVGAAAAAGVSTPTIRRRREQLVAAGAVVDPKGWSIPHSALVAAGFEPTWTTGADEKPQEPHQEPVQAGPTPEPTEELRVTQDRVRRLESENAILRSQVEQWQMVARERLDALNDLRVAFRFNAMAKPQQEIEQPKPIEPADLHPTEPKRENWFHRWFG